jgi:hypothetical protein
MTQIEIAEKILKQGDCSGIRCMHDKCPFSLEYQVCSIGTLYSPGSLVKVAEWLKNQPNPGTPIVAVEKYHCTVLDESCPHRDTDSSECNYGKFCVRQEIRAEDLPAAILSRCKGCIEYSEVNPTCHRLRDRWWEGGSELITADKFMYCRRMDLRDEPDDFIKALYRISRYKELRGIKV